MSDDYGVLYVELVRQTDDVTGDLKDVVGFEWLWLIRLTVTSEVWSNHPESCICNWLKLMPPRIPRLRKSMQEEHEWTLARLHAVHPYSIRFDESMLERCDRHDFQA